MQNIVLLDLEDTIIDDWDSFNVINEDKVKRFLDTLPFGRDDTIFGIFSFAIWDEKDRARFIDMRWGVEDTFNIKLNYDFIFDVKRIKRMVETHTTLHCHNVVEFLNFWDKESAMLTIVKAQMFANSRIFLIDDQIRSMLVQIHDTDTSIDFVNVKKLP